MKDPSYQFSSSWALSIMRSPSLKPNSPADSASKSYKARQQGCELRVGVVAGEGRGETAGPPQAVSPKAGLVREEACVGEPAGETPGDVEIRLRSPTGKLLLDEPGRWLNLADKL